VSPKLSFDDLKAIRKEFTYKVFGCEYTRAYQEHGWDGTKVLFFKNQTAPSGCAYHVARFLSKNLQHSVTVVHENDYTPRGKIEVHGFELKDFQKKAVKRAVKYRRGIIQAPVRAGKTAVAAAIFSRIGHYPAWIITNGKDLVKQARKDLEYHLQRPVGYFSESKFQAGDIIVTSYQALGRVVSDVQRRRKNESATKKQETIERNEAIVQLLNRSKVLIFDECHHALAPKNVKVFDELRAAGYVIGLSGTPRPDGAHTLELEAALGSIIFRVQFETLIKHKRLAEPKITMYKLPYRWFSTGLNRFMDVYKNNIVENVYRNKFIAEVAIRLRKAGKTSFVMIRRLDHGPILRSLIPGSVFVKGEIDSERRALLYQALQDKKIHCIIATVGKEGLNIPKLDAVINAEGYKGSVTTVQKLRSLTATEGKKYGLIIDFMDRGKFIGKHSRKRIEHYEKLGNTKVKFKQVPGGYYSMEA
jgi:superfamily II DNA or RNA helicase